MSDKIECMCLECGVSMFLPKNDISMDDPSDADSKLLDSFLVCENCGGRLSMIGKCQSAIFFPVSQFFFTKRFFLMFL